MKKIFLCSFLLVLVFSAIAADDIIVATFDGKDFSNWKVEGEAFGKRPSYKTLDAQMEV